MTNVFNSEYVLHEFQLLTAY